MGELPVIPADLTSARVTGRAYRHLLNWDDTPEPPFPGQHVLAADGGAERLEAMVTEVRDDGVLVLSVERELQVDLTIFGDSDVIETSVPRQFLGRVLVDDEFWVVDGRDAGRRLFRVVELSNGGRDARLMAANVKI